MNYELLDKSIVVNSGVWNWGDCVLKLLDENLEAIDSVKKDTYLQRAKELGFVGKYRWGVEYKTDGKQPALDGDVRVIVNSYNAGHFLAERAVSSNMWHLTHLFIITDQRYKPQDTSYLDNTKVEVDIIAQAEKEFSTSSPMFKSLFQAVFDNTIDKLEKDKKFEEERKRVIDAVCEAIHKFNHSEYVSASVLDFLYSTGYLRLPDNHE